MILVDSFLTHDNVRYKIYFFAKGCESWDVH